MCRTCDRRMVINSGEARWNSSVLLRQSRAAGSGVRACLAQKERDRHNGRSPQSIHGDPPADCRAKVITRGLWRQRGALALRRQQGADGVDFVINSARPKNIDRPWSPAVARRETPAATIAAVPGAQGARLGAPRDATPRQEDIEADQ